MSGFQAALATNLERQIPSSNAKAPVGLRMVEQNEKGGIRTKDLNFFYGSFHALHNISVEIPAKQVMALIGPSGCGK